LNSDPAVPVFVQVMSAAVVVQTYCARAGALAVTSSAIALIAAHEANRLIEIILSLFDNLAAPLCISGSS
jgi:hypothetical protein